MDNESKEKGWQKIKKKIEERQDFRARVLCDDMDVLLMQRELLDKLIEYKERREQVRALSEPPARTDPKGELTREEKLFYDRKCCQIYREVAFTTFIQNVFCSYMDLLDGASKELAWEIAEKNVNMLFEFLEHYNGLLKQEYDWQQASIKETTPPEA